MEDKIKELIESFKKRKELAQKESMQAIDDKSIGRLARAVGRSEAYMYAERDLKELLQYALK